MYKFYFLILTGLFPYILFAQSQAELDWANAQYLNGQLSEEELHDLGFAFTDEDEDNSYITPEFTDGIFIPTSGQVRVGYEHSTGTKQYLWIRCTFSDTDHRSGSPNSAVINNFNRWMWEIQRISYQQYGIDRLTILNLKLDATYQEAKDNGIGQFIQPKLQELRDSPQIIFDTTYNYYRMFVKGQDSPMQNRIHLDSLYDSNNPNHWRFTANTNGGSWVAGIGGKNISGGDTNVAFVHELGHNFGLGHQPRLLAQYGPAEKQAIGHYMPGEHNILVQANGSYTIRAYGSGSTEKEGLKLRNNDGSSTWIVLERHHKELQFESGLTFRGDAISAHRFLPTDVEQAARPSILIPTPPVLVVGKTMYNEQEARYITPSEIELDNEGRAIRATVLVHYRDNVPNNPPQISLSKTKECYQPYETIRINADASDPEDSKLYYYWKINGVVQLGLFNNPSLEFIKEQRGVYLVECVVSDGKGGQRSSTVTVEVGENNTQPTVYQGQILDINNLSVPSASVHLAQRLQAVSADYFDGLIDVYVFDEQQGLDFSVYEDWSVGTPTSTAQVSNIDYPEASGPTPNDVFKAQWNGKLIVPTSGMHITLPIDPHKKVKCRLIIDTNQDGIFDPSPNGGDEVCTSKIGEDLTNIVSVSQGTYDFRLQYSDSKGSGTVKFPFRQFGIYADLPNSNQNAGVKIRHDKSSALTSEDGMYNLIPSLSYDGQQVFVYPNHPDYDVDISDINNITLTKKLNISITNGMGGNTPSKLLYIAAGDSTKIIISPHPGYKIQTLLWNGVAQELSPYDGSTSYVYQTPVVTQSSTIHITYEKVGFGENLLINPSFDRPIAQEWQTTSPAIRKGKYLLTESNPLAQIIPLEDYFTSAQIDGETHATFVVNWDSKEKDGMHTALRTGLRFFDQSMQLISQWDRGTFKSPFVQHTLDLPNGTRFIEVIVSAEHPSLQIKIEEVILTLKDMAIQDNITTTSDKITLDLKSDISFDNDGNLRPNVVNLHSNDKYQFNGQLKTMKNKKTRLLSFDPVQEIIGFRSLVTGSKVHIHLDTLALQHLSATDTIQGIYSYTIGVNSINADQVISIDNQEECVLEIIGKNDPPYAVSTLPRDSISLGDNIQSYNISQYIKDIDQGDILIYSSNNMPDGLSFNGSILSGTPVSAGLYKIDIKATDPYGLYFQDTLEVLVKDPTLDFSLSNHTIDESETIGKAIGKLSTTAAQPLFSIWGENNHFYMEGDSLRSKKNFDYEVQNMYTVDIALVDQLTQKATIKTFVIHIIDVAEGPSTITISNNKIDSDLPTGTTIGGLESYHEEGLPVSYSLQNHTDVFSIDGDTLRTQGVLSYNSDKVFDLIIRATSNNGIFLDRVFKIYVKKRFHPIENIQFIGIDSIYENSLYTHYFGRLTAVKGGEVTYELVSGVVDNHFFNISGDSIQLKQKIFLEEIAQNPLVILVRGTDEKGNTLDKSIPIKILNDPKLFRWIGVSDTNWHNTSNWNTGTLPTDIHDVVIPADTPFHPIISQESVIINSITVLKLATLEIASHTLTVH